MAFFDLLSACTITWVLVVGVAAFRKGISYGCITPLVAVVGLAGLGGGTGDVSASIGMLLGAGLAVVAIEQHDRRQESALRARVAAARAKVLASDAKAFASAMYHGGLNGLSSQRVELFSTAIDLVVAPTASADVPACIPFEEIKALTLDDQNQVYSTTDVIGGVLWGGGGAAKSVTSSPRERLLIHWGPHTAAQCEAAFSGHGESSRQLHAAVAGEVAKALTALREDFGLGEKRLNAGGIDVGSPHRAAHTPRHGESGVASAGAAGTKRCPFCDEEIRVAARVCRYCQRDLP